MVQIAKWMLPETIAEIKRLYQEEGLTNKQISQHFGKHVNTIERYTSELTRKRKERTIENYVTELWPLEDIEYLIEWWDKDSSQDIAYALDKTRKQVDSKLTSLKRDGWVKHKTKGEVMNDSSN